MRHGRPRTPGPAAANDATSQTAGTRKSTPAGGDAVDYIADEFPQVGAGVCESVKSNDADGTSTTVWKVSKDTASYQEFAYISKNVVTLGDADNQDGGSQQVTASDGKGGTKVIPGLSFVNKSIYDRNDNRNRDKADTYFNKATSPETMEARAATVSTASSPASRTTRPAS